MLSLQVSQLWKEVVIRVSKDYPDVELSHMYIDNAAMQLLRNPKYFDVVVTGVLFGTFVVARCNETFTETACALPPPVPCSLQSAV